MEIAQRCLKCFYAAREPNPTPDQIIAGQVPVMCLGAPPSAQFVNTPSGTVTVSLYPMVNGKSVSCAMFIEKLLVPS